ncbi:4-amino-4-deoxychorismate lyase [Rathayibacter oskolensis]|uniref:4-amino-4-deoxychorismate lyase n=1 Tax=Rathayibacter oskolensis TaxID=1891671 RepID=A0A1X7NS87_9MICO|nr:aminotransferase class IV [Rathayibacter oskolensis]SMH40200.1 4-amino-4-deoxychorismate lyase [Rathayibacter oskolensis]
MPADTLVRLARPSLDAGGDDAASGSTLDPSGTGGIDATDLGFTRGDGVFETINLVDGRLQALDAHLDRFERSAAMLELPRPDRAAWLDAIGLAVAEHPRVPEAMVKTVLTRGVEGDDRPTGLVFVQTSPDFTAARRDGVRIVLLDRGLRSDVQETSPWLLAGAKTLSYAVNRAASREAVRRGADDALFVSTDGFLLEGPTSNLVLLLGGALVTPPPTLGLLPGTTQADLFALAGGLGLGSAYRPVRAGDLETAESAWLVSSARNAAPIREVDGRPRAVDSALSARINAALLGR